MIKIQKIFIKNNRVSQEKVPGTDKEKNRKERIKENPYI